LSGEQFVQFSLKPIQTWQRNSQKSTGFFLTKHGVYTPL